MFEQVVIMLREISLSSGLKVERRFTLHTVFSRLKGLCHAILVFFFKAKSVFASNEFQK